MALAALAVSLVLASGSAMRQPAYGQVPPGAEPISAPAQTAGPTAAPTAMPTIDPTSPTAMPFVSYLPSACMSTEPALRADIVLLVDTSASMAGVRLDAARAAAGALLDQMNPRRDHAAVVSFDRSPRTAVYLTSNRAEIDRGLAALRSGSPGTRFDLAISVARRELLHDSGERDFANRGVIVMLSDSRHDGLANDAIAEAFFTGTAGFAIYTVGLGPDADQELLAAIADTGAHFAAGDESGLEPAFEEIGRRIRRLQGWCGG